MILQEKKKKNIASQQVYFTCKVKLRYAWVPEFKIPKDQICNGGF